MKKKMRYCFWCGEELGVDDFYDPYDHCGKRECAREADYAHRADEDERRRLAEEDGFSRY